MKIPAEKGRANWPLCLVFPKGRIEGVKANFLGAPPIFILACVVSGNDRLTEASRQGCLRSQEVCPTLAQRFSLFQGVATPHEGSCGKDVSQQSG